MKTDQFNSNEEYSDDKFKILNFTGDKGSFKRISSLKEAICLLPFDVNENNQIKNVYLAKYHDYVLDKENHRCITSTLQPDEFNTYHESLSDCIDQELGLSDVDINDIFYLGQIQHTVPFTKTYKCYALNLTNNSEEPTGFTANVLNPDAKLHSVDKVRFSRVMKGEVCDTLTLSCSILLLSYISE
jgi:hypothetical protein